MILCQHGQLYSTGIYYDHIFPDPYIINEICMFSYKIKHILQSVERNV